MSKWKEITAKEIPFNFNKKMAEQWALLTVKYGNEINTMTIGWADMGYLWNKNVMTVYVRPSRHTFDLIEKSEGFSVSFFDKSYQDKLTFCGRNSGKDIDKIEECGFTVAYVDGVPYIEQNEYGFICKTIYTAPIKEENLKENYKNIMDSCYSTGDLHTLYVGEIQTILQKK